MTWFTPARLRRMQLATVAVVAVMVPVFVLRDVCGPRWLSETDSPAWARALMWFGVDPNTTSPGQRSPFDAQAASGNHELVLLMLDAGAAVDARGKMGVTALMSAAYRGHLQIVRVLVERGGADIDLVGDCYTAYQLAVAFHHDEVAAYLVSRGARTDPAPCR